MTEQEAEPEDSCLYYEICGNTIPQNGLMCNECIGLARHKDKLGEDREGNIMEFLQLLYEEYDDEHDVMKTLHEDGPEVVVHNATRGN